MLVISKISGPDLKLSELILATLAKELKPLSAREITTAVNSNTLKGFRERGVRKALESLKKKSILQETKHGLVKKYIIDHQALEDGILEAQRYIRGSTIFHQIALSRNEEAFIKTIEFTKLKNLDQFIERFEEFWIKNLRKLEKKVFYEQLYNRWCLQDPTIDQDHKKTGITHYVITQDKSFTNIKKAGKWSIRNAYIRTGALLSNDWDAVVLGDYVLSVRYGEQTLNEIRKIYANKSSGPILSKLQNIQGKMMVTIQKNNVLAKMLKKNIENSFLKQTESFLKKEKGVLVLDQKYQYVLPEQVNILTSSREAKQVHGESNPWMLSESKLNTIQKSLKNIDQLFPSKESLSIIELGPGPFVKPVIILNQLLGTYPDMEYVGVDFSKEILQRAQDSAHKFLPQVKQRKFIQTDFMDLVNDPDILLSSISHRQKLFMLIGSTYSCFEADQINKILKSILKPGDCFIIDIESLDSKEDFKDIKERYEDELYSYFDMLVFYEIGFTKDCFDIVYKFNENTWSVEGVAIVKEIPQHLLPKIKQMNIKVGDQIRCFKSRKPTKKMFQDELQALGNVDLTMLRGSGNTKRHLLAFGQISKN